MSMTRRSLLIGGGTVVVGGGAALGTGAFSSVEADRSVTLNTAGDSDALLSLAITNDTLSGEDGADVISVAVDDLNLDAVTTFTDALTIGSTAAESVTVDIFEAAAGEPTDGLDSLVLERGSDNPADADPGIYFVVDSEDLSGGEIEIGGSAGGADVTVDVVINTIGEDDQSDPPLADIDSLLFVATSE